MSQTFIGQEVAVFADSIHTYHIKGFDSELMSFQKDFQRITDCCCSKEYIKKESHLLNLVGEYLGEKAQVLDTIKTHIHNEGLKFTRTLVKDFLASYVSGRPDIMLILDSSVVTIKACTDESIYLTDDVILEIESNANYRANLAELKELLDTNLNELFASMRATKHE